MTLPQKHHVRLLAPARVRQPAGDEIQEILRFPDDGILCVTEGEKDRLVKELGIAEDLTEEFDTDYFGEADPQPAADSAANPKVSKKQQKKRSV